MANVLHVKSTTVCVNLKESKHHWVETKKYEDSWTKVCNTNMIFLPQSYIICTNIQLIDYNRITARQNHAQYMHYVWLGGLSCFRHAIEARVHLANGHQMLVEFDSASTADEVGFLTTFLCLPSYPHMQLPDTFLHIFLSHLPSYPHVQLPDTFLHIFLSQLPTCATPRHLSSHLPFPSSQLPTHATPRHLSSHLHYDIVGRLKAFSVVMFDWMLQSLLI